MKYPDSPTAAEVAANERRSQARIAAHERRLNEARGRSPVKVATAEPGPQMRLALALIMGLTAGVPCKPSPTGRQ